MQSDPSTSSLLSASTQQRQPTSPTPTPFFFVVMGTICLLLIGIGDRVTERANSRVKEAPWISDARDARGVFRQTVGRDSMLRRLSALPSTPRLQLLVAEAAKPAVQFGSLFLRDMADSTATGRVIAIIEPHGFDSVGGIRPIRRSRFSVVPSGLDGKTCITWIGVPTSAANPSWAYRRLRIDNDQGPCHIIAAFGLPSPKRSAWLDARGWLPTVGFQSRPYPRELPDDWKRQRNPGAGWFVRAMRGTYVGMFVSGVLGASGIAVRCIEGDSAACTEFMFGRSLVRTERDDPDASTFHVAGIVPGTAWDSSTSSGSIGYLIRAYGEEKFRRWWTTRDTTEAGFEAAFGESVLRVAQIRARDVDVVRLPVPTVRWREVVPAVIVLLVSVAWLAAPAPREASV